MRRLWTFSGAGSGKTLLAMEFIVRGTRDLGEPGVFMTLEETAENLTHNVASLGFDLDDLVRRKKLEVNAKRIARLDTMLGSRGGYRSGSIWVSGNTSPGKTSLTARERNRSQANRGISLNSVPQSLSRIVQRLTTVLDPATASICTGFASRESVR